MNDDQKQYAVIFDMDGVLIDSLYFVWEAFREMLEPYEIKVDDEFIKKYLGYSTKDQIAMWEKDFHIDLPENKEFNVKATEIEMRMLEQNVIVKEGLIDLLDDLKQNNFKLAVGTNSQRPRALKILDLLTVRKYFDAVLTEEDVEKHKPDPELYLKAVQKIGVEPENALVIEDAPVGVEAAKKAHIKCVGFLTNYNSEEELKDADLTIKSFKDLSAEKIKGVIREEK